MLLVSQKFQMLFSSTYFYCISLYFASQKLGLLQIEAKTLHQQKEYASLYCDARFTVVVSNRTHVIATIRPCSSTCKPHHPAHQQATKIYSLHNNKNPTATFTGGVTSKKNSPAAWLSWRGYSGAPPAHLEAWIFFSVSFLSHRGQRLSEPAQKLLSYMALT